MDREADRSTLSFEVAADAAKVEQTGMLDSKSGQQTGFKPPNISQEGLDHECVMKFSDEAVHSVSFPFHSDHVLLIEGLITFSHLSLFLFAILASQIKTHNYCYTNVCKTSHNTITVRITAWLYSSH